MDALDAIYNDKRCQDVKGVRDALLLSQSIIFHPYSIKNKLASVTECLKLIPEGLKDYDTINSSLVHFHKVVKFLTISAERMELACPLHNGVLVNIDEIKVKVNNFLYEIGYNFIKKFLEEVKKALEEASNVLIAYVFHLDSDQRKSKLYYEEQFSMLSNHHGNEIFKQ